MKPRLLIIANRTLHNAPRVIREIAALKNDFEITAVGTTAPTEKSINYIDIKTLNFSLPLKVVKKAFNLLMKKNFMEIILPSRMTKLKQLVKDSGASYIILHEVEFLPYLAKIKKERKLKIIFNAHEYYPAEFEDNKRWVKIWKPYYENIYRELLHEVDLLINVCDSIAERCKKEFGKDSIVIPNAAFFQKNLPADNRDADKIKLIYHGFCNESRRIEEMIKVAELLGDAYSFDFMFSNSEGSYFSKIQETVRTVLNVKLIPPVQFEDIISVSNTYDIGVFLLPPTNFNYQVALPNKLFEFIQARLCIAISPSIEMKRVVEKFNLGVVAEDFSALSLAKQILKLSKEDIHQFKLNSDKAASQISAEHYNALFLKAVKEL